MVPCARLFALVGVLGLSPSTVSARHPDHGAARPLHEVITDRTPDRQSPFTGQTCWKAALHMHGILSEGDASIRSHHEAAKLLGIDVIWWTDHDHMIVSEAHRATRFSFDALSESLAAGEPWTPNWIVDIVFTKSAVFFRSAFQEQSAQISTERAAVGTGSLRMSGRRQHADRGSFMYLFNAEATRRRISVAAGLTLRMKVFPEVTGPEATGVMTMILSRTVTPEIQSPNRLEIQYYLSNGGEPPTREDYIYRVPVPFVPGEWNEIVMPITQDAVAGYPFIDGRDNSLTEILFGLESRNNAMAVCYFDDLRLDIEADGAALFATQRVMLDEYNTLADGVVHHQGVEHSYVLPHMLEYGPGTPLPDWQAYQSLSPGFVNGWLVNGPAHNEFIANRVSTLAHARGAAVSYAHPFGTGTGLLASTPTKEQLLTRLMTNNTFNSDLLEVGYRQRERPMADHLWVWDQLALYRRFLTGVGVSDGHSGNIDEYLNDPTFSMTQFVYADSSAEADLAHALRAGRTFYADPVIFDGVIDLRADNGALMGAVVVTDRSAVDASFRLRGLEAGDSVRVVDSGVPGPAVEMTGSDADLPVTVAVGEDSVAFIRAEVYSQTPGRPEKAFSNPIYFVRQVPSGGVDWRRVFVEYAGVTASEFEHFRLTDVLTAAEGADTVLSITGHEDGGPGAVMIDLSAVPAPARVTLEDGLTGTLELGPGFANASGLSGAGAIRVRWPRACAADLDADGSVGVDDLNFLLSRWAESGHGAAAADLSGDGEVGVDDLNLVLGAWGARCD